MILETYRQLTAEAQSRVIEMAWEDRTPFEAIEMQFGFIEKDIIRIMQCHLKLQSFKHWRKRVSGRVTIVKRSTKFERGAESNVRYFDNTHSGIHSGIHSCIQAVLIPC
ncbi:MAG: hypothetical protein ACJAVI_002516 [Candidatus Azotimanducaceae bacterium]|jgi:uncharacterized protein (TIGR03643 family)